MITYSAAICAWDKVKQPGLAMMLLLGLEPNVVTYSTANSAAASACKVGKPSDKAFELCDAINAPQPTRSYTVLGFAHARRACCR